MIPNHTHERVFEVMCTCTTCYAENNGCNLFYLYSVSIAVKNVVIPENSVQVSDFVLYIFSFWDITCHS